MIVIIVPIIINIIKDIVDFLNKFAIWLGVSDLHLIMLILNNITTIKRVKSFKYKAFS
jgi:hypothetical protein